MVFSSITFLFYFLPIFLFFYFISKYKNGVLLCASLLFYAWGELEYVSILIASIIINYSIGLMISRTRLKRLWLFIGIVLNISPLILFKYLNLIVDTINPLIDMANLNPIVLTPIHLPMGISFFTFQAMSYLMDVYRNDAPAEKNIFTVALYISMFPQLLAGPIVRFHTIAQALKKRQESNTQFSKGIRFFIIGLSQKVLVSNTLTFSVNQIFALPLSEIGFSLSWLAAIGYTLQIYFDFAGYSNMAIGLGLMLGFELPQNFNYPYVSQSIGEFWRRWHITLSQWFRDYLYIPLGGNQKGPVRLYLNLFIVFFICGLWHGASYTFVIWGLYHGLFLIIERMGLKSFLDRLPRPFRHIYALLVIIVGWIFFRANTFDQAFTFIKAMAGFQDGGKAYTIAQYLSLDVMIAMGLGTFLSGPHYEIITAFSNKLQLTPRQSTVVWTPVFQTISLIVTFILALMCLASGAYNPFIYFKF